MRERPYKKLLRLNQSEKDRLLYLSKSTGLNQEQVLRKALMNAPLLERPTADYLKMSYQISALGNNLNQLAHVANASGNANNTDLLIARQIMEKVWMYIKGGGVPYDKRPSVRMKIDHYRAVAKAISETQKALQKGIKEAVTKEAR